MKVLILTSTNSSGDITNDIHHVDPGVYVQFIDPTKSKPKDIAKVRWDVAIIDKELELGIGGITKWMQALSAYCYRVIQLH